MGRSSAGKSHRVKQSTCVCAYVCVCMCMCHHVLLKNINYYSSRLSTLSCVCVCGPLKDSGCLGGQDENSKKVTCCKRRGTSVQNVVTHVTTFCPLEGHPRGHFTTCCPVEECSRGNFMMLYLPQWKPTRHFHSVFSNMRASGGNRITNPAIKLRIIVSYYWPFCDAITQVTMPNQSVHLLDIRENRFMVLVRLKPDF